MKIQVCTGKICKERFSEYILKRLERDKEKFGLDNVMISNCACMGHCKDGPNIMFDKHVEHHADPLKASKIMMDKLKCKNTNFDSKKNNKKTINDDSNSYFKNN